MTKKSSARVDKIQRHFLIIDSVILVDCNLVLPLMNKVLKHIQKKRCKLI
ncbi:GSCOCG00003565001-RA-CDS [Cotesia congregata]|nr:GSCOCG00003565001-RA-CDS [Cotesia congregata]